MTTENVDIRVIGNNEIIDYLIFSNIFLINFKIFHYNISYLINFHSFKA